MLEQLEMSSATLTILAYIAMSKKDKRSGAVVLGGDRGDSAKFAK